MQTKFKNLKNDLENLEDGSHLQNDPEISSFKGNSKLANYILLIAFIATLLFYAGSRMSLPDLNPIDNIVQELNQPNVDLLNDMGDWLEEMGYGTLTHQQLMELREEGVTATYTSEIRAVGYTDVTLDQMVDLSRADVSAEFARMMKELGYELSIEDLVRLRSDGVTAYFTSNMMDLGYTFEELSKENLSRMRSVGVTHELAERLIAERESKPTVDELIRYRISNQ